MTLRTMHGEIERIRKLVGPVTREQLRYVDCYTSEDLALFMPAGGACFFARTPCHSHPAYMFILHFDDQTSVEIAGRKLTACYGKLFGLPPDTMHHELPSDYPPRYIAVLVSREFFEKERLQYHSCHEFSTLADFYDPDPTLLPLLKRFMIEADGRLPGCDGVLRALGFEICHSIIRSILDLHIESDSISSRIEINRSVEFLHANLDKKITVKKMAGIACMSASHFSRIFKQELGKSPADYLSAIRLGRAKRLLMAGDKSITEIALECGFNNSAYLSSCFQKKYNISPSVFRRNLSAKETVK